MDARQGLRRVGIFGGTFNPVHRGHVQVAREAKEACGLEHLSVVPAAIPPHKGMEGIAAADDRLEMTRLAFAGMEGFSVSDLEIRREGPSYTIDTVRAFRETQEEGTEVFLLIGIDAFLELHTWMAHKKLFQEAPLLVMSRPVAHAGVSLREAIGEYLRKHISIRYAYADERGCFEAVDTRPVHPVKVSAVDISSTMIRERVRQGRSIESLVPVQVADYIGRKRLYR